MPLAFGAHAGSMLALTGTPVNSSSRRPRRRRRRRFGFLEFALVGVPLVIGTVVIMCCSATACCPTATAELDARPTSATRPDAATSTGWTTPPTPLRRAAASRGRDPAALGLDRRRPLPGHGHRQRRPGLLAVQRKGEELGAGDWPGRRRRPAARGPRGPRSATTWPGRTSSSSTRPTGPAQACRSARARERAIVILAGMVVLLATGCRRRSPACRGGRHGARAGVPCDRPTAASLDDRRARGRHDPAVDGDDRRPVPRTRVADALRRRGRRRRAVCAAGRDSLITAVSAS